MKTLKILTVNAVIILAILIPHLVLSQNTFRCLEFRSPTDGIAAGDNGMILKTSDGGSTWYISESNTIQNLNKTTVIDGDIMLAAGNSGTIVRSPDGGDTWVQVESNTTQNLKGIFVNANGIGLAVGNNGTFLNTTDHGLTWSIPERIDFNGNLNTVAMNDESNAIIMGDKNGIALSSDAGSSWSGPPSILSFEMSFIFARYIDRDYIFATSSHGEIVKSANRGETWEVVYSDPSHLPFYRVNLVGSNLVAAGEFGKIIISQDMGATWYEMSSGTSSSLYCMSFADEYTGYAAGADGILLRTNDGGYTWEKVNYALLKAPVSKTGSTGTDIPEKFSLNQNYPNPFNPETNISYSIRTDGFVSMKVYDITGKEVSSLVSNYQKAGSYSVKFSGINLTSGIYFYNLTVNGPAGSYSKTMKMILAK